MVSLEVLQVTWWVILGVLLIGFALTDGFDLGVASLLTTLAKSDQERRLLINTIAPVWESNQVWLILFAGAIFAAWPVVYAVAFSTMYLAMLLILVCLIIRPVGLKFRSKMPEARWRNAWDWSLCITSVIPSLIFGVAIGNMILGLPFSFNDDLMLETKSVFFSLFTPFSILTGFVGLSMLLAHGAAYLRLKIDHEIANKAHSVQKLASFTSLVCFISAGLVLNYGGFGFTLTEAPRAQNILTKMVDWHCIATSVDLSQRFFGSYTLLAAMFAVLGFVLSMVSGKKHPSVGFLATSLSNIGVIATLGFATFPFILPSTISPNHSLTVWDASSSQLTLLIMLVVVLILLPITLIYVIWAYKVFAKRLTLKDLADPQMY